MKDLYISLGHIKEDENGNIIMKKNYDKIPEYEPSFTELSKQMRINADIVMKEISEHVDKEIKRLKDVFPANKFD